MTLVLLYFLGPNIDKKEKNGWPLQKNFKEEIFEKNKFDKRMFGMYGFHSKKMKKILYRVIKIRGLKTYLYCGLYILNPLFGLVHG